MRGTEDGTRDAGPLRGPGNGRGCRLLWAAVCCAALLSAGCAHVARVRSDGRQMPEGAKQAARGDTASAQQAARQKAPDSVPLPQLSAASALLVKSCDNYLSLNQTSPKAADVMTIKASLFYNNRLFAQSRAVYGRLIESYPNTPSAAEALRMIAQGFYEEKQFDSAQAWYRKLSTVSGPGVDKREAVERIAESIFRRAEQYEAGSRFKEAAEQYQRISLEFPDVKIADVSLFNAGLCYEKQAEWEHVILVLQQLLQKYPDSKLIPKAMFRIGMSNAKLLKWDPAANAYLRLVARFPTSEMAPTALYNAGFAFENAEKLPEAAATFEKMIQLYPNTDDAADILFKAGEMYGRLKNWEAVTRVNQLFTTRFGNDADRVVQALCMVGIALYMQNREDAAIEQLKNAVATYARIKNPSTMNAFYAAKAQFTLGEIQHARMGAIALSSVKAAYQKQLAQKSDLLDRAVDAYSLVLKFNISEWTTRAVCQIGQAYEDFGSGIFKQERPAGLSLDERLALELGIAQATDKYFVGKALKYHEQNVKLAIKEKLEDKYILESRRKLTGLPYRAGQNYLALATIAKSAEGAQKIEGFALIARKLELLQKIAPFQERASELFLKCLEIGTTYQETDDFYRKASSSVTGTSFSVAETYADLVTIVLDAPLPSTFGHYERFVYKTKLLKQVEGYQEQAMTGYLKTLKIAEAYSINDDNIRMARERLAKLLFTIGRCKDLLCIEAFTHPPFPKDISDAEKEEYRGRFEEIGLRYQEAAFEVYASILKFAAQKYASGPYVTHAYVRLFQNFPEKYGAPQESAKDTVLAGAAGWTCSADSAPGWAGVDFRDSAWAPARLPAAAPPVPAGFPADLPQPGPVTGAGTANAGGVDSAVFFRRAFTMAAQPREAQLFLAGRGPLTVFLNGEPLPGDSGATAGTAVAVNCMGKLRTGKNVISIRAAATPGGGVILWPLVKLKTVSQTFAARPPEAAEPLPPEKVRQGAYQFPAIKNFELEPGAAQQ